MEAARAWARSQRRQNRRSIVGLVLLVGLSTGVALAALAGARRSDTAHERLLEATAASHARVQYASSDDIDDEVVARLQADEGVELAVPVWFTIAFSDASEFDIGVVHSPDPAFLHDIDRVRLREGRLPSPSSPDEVVAGEFLADEMGLRVGDAIALSTFSQEQLEQEGFDQAPAGPLLELEVVGIGLTPDELSAENSALLFAGPGYFEATAGRAGGFGPTIVMRVAGGADVEEIVADAMAGLPLDEVPFIDRATDRAQRVQDALRVLAVGLAVFAACAGLAASAASGQAIGRALSSATPDQVALHALGFTRRQRFVAALLVLAPVAVGGAALATLVAVAASPLLPVGLARRAEPSPGLDVDLAVLLPGAVAIAVLVAALAGLSAWRLASGHTAQAEPRRAHRSVGAATAARAGWSAPAVLGITMALEAGRGRSAVPVRSALVGSVLGITGVVAALTFGSSLDRLVSTPSAYGWNWSIKADLFDGDSETVAALPEVDEVGTLLIRQVEVEGRQLDGAAVMAVEGAPSLTVLAGRMPASVGEVALGPKTLDQLDRRIGDRVALGSADGDLSVTVVGEVLFPIFDENPFNEGVAFHPDLVDDIELSDGFGAAMIGFAPGVTEDEGVAAVAAVLPEAINVYSFPSRPGDVENLARVSGVPFALAGFLVVVALAAVAHALASSVRRRARDLGVVRALGFTRLDLLTTVGVQSLTLVVVGLAFGLPLGVALGRVVWSVVADGLGVARLPEVPLLALVLVVVGAAGTALVIAAGPARRAATSPPAVALRTE